MDLDPTLLAQIQRLVRPLTPAQRRTVIQSIVELPAEESSPKSDEPDAAHAARRAEQEAWFAQPASVREPFRGEYVAVRGGPVVDHDPDRRALGLRMRERFGRYGALIVHADWDEVPTFSIRAPRLER